MKNEIIKWLRITRLGTLIISFCPVVVGIIIASKYVDINWVIGVLTIICAMSLQALSNMINDYFDFKNGIDTPQYNGYEKPLVEGILSIEKQKKYILIVLCVSILSGLFLSLKGGSFIIIIGLFALLSAWYYTATKKSLSHLGIGDIFVFLLFGPIATIGTVYLQTGEFNMESLWGGFVCGAIATGVLIVNNIRDRETDALAKRKSFAVRFGKSASEIEYLIFILSTFLFTYIPYGLSITNLIVLFGLVLFLMLISAKGEKYNIVLVLTSILNVIFIILLLINNLFQ